MLNNYMVEAVESVYGSHNLNSQNNSRHSSQQQLALPLSSSSISTDSLRNSSSSVHLNQPQQINHHHHYHPYLQINHQQCNHQISTSDSCQSITENIYSNQQIINNLNKSKSANTINYSNHQLIDNDQLEASLIKARQRVYKLKKDLENSNLNDHNLNSNNVNTIHNSENHVIYTNQSAILAQQKQQLEISQKINNNNQSSIDENFKLLSLIDKYYRKTDSKAVEV
jgi:hypothetical protein